MISPGLSSLLKFLLASPQARGWGSAYCAYHVFPVAASVESKGLAHPGGPWLLPLELWFAPSPHCYCCCYHQMIYWRLGCKRTKKKRQRKKNRCLLFCISPFSWSSRQNQRAFPGTLFVDANTHFKILHCIGFSPGDIGGGKNNKFTTDLCYFDIWSALRHHNACKPFIVGPST